jgi:hypothetical protein
MKKSKITLPQESIENKIHYIRGKTLMVDRDLAILYGVKTKTLNQAVKRNLARFPEDFMMQLTLDEKNELVTNCDRFKMLKHSTSLPYAFSEQGVAMLSSILRSERAIQVNIQIMRTFVRLRQILTNNKELTHKLHVLENKCDSKFRKHDKEIRLIFQAIKQLMQPQERSKEQIGFHTQAK